MNDFNLIGIYLLGFVAFSFVMYQQNKIVKAQRRMIADDMDVIGRAHDSLNRLIQISCMIFEDPDKYPEQIKAYKNGLEELKKFAEEIEKTPV